MTVDPKHHRHFVARRGEVLRRIGDEFGDSPPHPLDGVDLVGQHLWRLIDGLVGLWTLLQ